MSDTFGPRPYGPSEFLLGLERAYCFVPAVVLTCTLSHYRSAILNKTPCVRPSLLLWFKVGTATAIAAAQLLIIGRWWQSGVDPTALAWLGAFLSGVGVYSLVALVYTSHLFSANSMPFLTIFLTMTLFFDVAIVETYFNPFGADGITHPKAFVLLKLALLLLEQLSKRHLALQPHLGISGQTLETPLVQWFKRIYTFDFYSDIIPDDVRRVKEDSPQELLEDLFMGQWNEVDKQDPDALSSLCFELLRDRFRLGLLPRLLVITISVMQPLFVGDVIVAIAIETPPSEVVKKLVVAAAVIYSSIATFEAWHGHLTSKYTINVKGMLMGALYHKTLKLKERDSNASELTSLMTSDVDGVAEFFGHYYHTRVNIIEISLHLVLLMYLTGVLSILVLVPVFVSRHLSFKFTRSAPASRQRWRDHSDARISATSNILAQIRDVKMLGLGGALASVLQNRQDAEIKASMRTCELAAVGFSTRALMESTVPAMAIGIAMFLTSRPLSVADIFSILVLMVGIVRPASALMSAASDRDRQSLTLRRIQKYLLKAENIDQRSLTREPMSHPGLISSGTTLPMRRSQRIMAKRFIVKFIDVALTVGMTGPLLRDIRVNIPRGKVAMFWGETGGGKSALLSAIIGRVKLVTGHMILATMTSIAYCDQRPWIQNMSIRDNIIGPNDYDDYWFRQVLYICALDTDLARLPNRELTMAGSDGCNLSGGQKQRIALARALFARTKLLILDDVFSPLDKKTSSDIRVRLFGQNRPLHTYGITVIMSTSMTEHLVDADIAFEVTEGRVVERSPASRGASPRFQPAQVRLQNAVVEALEEVPPVTEPEVPIVRSTTDRPDRDLDPSQTTSGGFSLYRYALAPAGSGILVCWFLTVIIAAVVEKLPDVVMAVWLDLAADSRIFYLVYVIVGLCNPVTNFIAATSHYFWVYPKTAGKLHEKVAQTTFKATYDHLMGYDASHLLNKFSRDVSLTTEKLPNQMMPLAWALVSVVMNLTVISVPFSSTVPFISLCAAIHILWMLSKGISRRIGTLEAGTKQSLTKLLHETTAGLEHIYAFHWQQAFGRQFHATLLELQAVDYRRRRINVSLKLLLDYATTAATVIGVSHALTSSHVSSKAAVGHAMIRLICFSDEIKYVMRSWLRVEESLTAVFRIRQFVKTAPQEAQVTSHPQIGVNWPSRGSVRLNCVSATYQPEGASAFTALKHVSVRVEPGEKLAIAGRSGSGKTTIFMTILGMLKFSGSISIDGREIRTIPADALRSRITTLTQCGLQLVGSVRFNMDPFDPALRPIELIVNDDMLIGILRRVGIWSLIEKHGGLDADMFVIKLSYGQKQMFQLARAILHKQTMRTKIVLIDEATSAVDSETDDRMQQVIREVFDDCTMLMVSHRPSVFTKADLILTLKRGEAAVYRHERQDDRWRPTPER